jgi:hypothetical protein
MGGKERGRAEEKKKGVAEEGREIIPVMQSKEEREREKNGDKDNTSFKTS